MATPMNVRLTRNGREPSDKWTLTVARAIEGTPVHTFTMTDAEVASAMNDFRGTSGTDRVSFGPVRLTGYDNVTIARFREYFEMIEQSEARFLQPAGGP